MLLNQRLDLILAKKTVIPANPPLDLVAKSLFRLSPWILTKCQFLDPFKPGLVPGFFLPASNPPGKSLLVDRLQDRGRARASHN